jgi:hypothetical protein
MYLECSLRLKSMIKDLSAYMTNEQPSDEVLYNKSMSYYNFVQDLLSLCLVGHFLPIYEKLHPLIISPVTLFGKTVMFFKCFISSSFVGAPKRISAIESLAYIRDTLLTLQSHWKVRNLRSTCTKIDLI